MFINVHLYPLFLQDIIVSKRWKMNHIKNNSHIYACNFNAWLLKWQEINNKNDFCQKNKRNNI